MTTHRYSANEEDIGNRFIHLTNTSIQCLSSTGATIDNPLRHAGSSEAGGTKVTLSYLWRRLRATGVDVHRLWDRICMVVLKSLVSVENAIPFQPNSFEVFGYDVLIDKQLRPWLIEVNASPQMNRDNALDKEVKEALIKDTVRLVDPLPFDREALLRVMGRRLDTARTKSARPYRAAGDSEGMRESDLNEILMGATPRAHGEMPAKLGGYTRLAPGTPLFHRVERLTAKMRRKGRPA
ncbi:unnamed protein product [Chrysoparadoxa australica]